MNLVSRGGEHKSKVRSLHMHSFKHFFFFSFSSSLSLSLIHKIESPNVYHI